MGHWKMVGGPEGEWDKVSTTDSNVQACALRKIENLLETWWGA